MQEILDGQMGLWDGIPSGKMSPDASQATPGATSKSSSRNSSVSRNRQLLLCLCLRKESGHTPGASMEWEQTDYPFPWLGKSMTPNGGVFLKDGNAYAYFATMPDTRQERYCLTLNIGEKPRVENPTRLSQILEGSPDAKYMLSARACDGILRRASRREKELPQELREALERQAAESGGCGCVQSDD